VADRLPILYALILAVETVVLLVRYAGDPPASSSRLSVYLGWGGLLAMVVMLIYSVARRSRRLRQTARLSYWLHFHIFMGVQGAILVLFHSAHLFLREAPLNVLNPGFLSFAAVMVVFFSGIFGRYMYAMLPRTIQGERMEAKDIEQEIRGMSGELPKEVAALWSGAAAAQGFIGLLKADLATRGAAGKLSSLGLTAEVEALARRRLLLERRLISYHAAEKIFRRWIIAHRPLAAIMYVLAAVHILLSYMFTPGL
jgi:hypothetical protein